MTSLKTGGAPRARRPSVGSGNYGLFVLRFHRCGELGLDSFGNAVGVLVVRVHVDELVIDFKQVEVFGVETLFALFEQVTRRSQLLDDRSRGQVDGGTSRDQLADDHVLL